MDISDLSDDNMRGYCYFSRKIYDEAGNFTLEPKINYETNLCFCYKQLADNTSLNWFYPELIEIKKIQAQKKKEQEERLRKTFENMDKRLNPLQGLIGKQLDELINPNWKKNLGIINDPFMGSVKLSQPILDQAKITSDWMKQNKGLLDQKTAIFNVHGTEIEKIQSMLKGVNNASLGLSSSRKFEEVVKPAWRKQLDELKGMQALHNSPITLAYVNTAEATLKTLGGHLALRDKIASIKPYQDEIDKILSLGVDAQIARAMYGTHSELLEQFRNLKPSKKPNKSKKYWKQKAKQIGVEKAKSLEEKDKVHSKELREVRKAHAKELKELKEENRIMLLAMANDTHQNTPRTEPSWEAGRPIDTEPACFITFALETYWHSKNNDGQKMERVPDDKELRRWLIAKRDSEFKITIVEGYYIKINTKGYHIDNTANPEKTVSFKSFTKSFDTVLTKITIQKNK